LRAGPPHFYGTGPDRVYNKSQKHAVCLTDRDRDDNRDEDAGGDHKSCYGR